ncbi:MAG: ester cyclase [Pseudomonadota bacterium]
MNRLIVSSFIVLLLQLFVTNSAIAQNSTGRIQPPRTSQEQGFNHRNTIPKNFKTIIIAGNDKDRARAELIVDIYKVLESNPSIENVRKYVSDNYIQHSSALPDGPQPLAMLFSYSAAKFSNAAIDVHKIIVVGDWAMAHVNFRNLETNDPRDLGVAAVDMYLFGPDGKIEEHWDVLQSVPTHAPNPNGMFLKLFKDNKKD